MATFNNTSKQSGFRARAEDRIDLTVLLGMHVSTLTKNSKPSVSFATRREAARLASARHALEQKLAAALEASRHFIGYLSNLLEIRRIKKSLSELNQKILQWMSTTAKFYANKISAAINYSI